MDAVVKGLIGGATVSLLTVVAGSVAVFSNFWQYASTPYIVYIWMLVLTSLTVGQLVLTSFVASTLMEVPSQTASATVS